MTERFQGSQVEIVSKLPDSEDAAEDLYYDILDDPASCGFDRKLLELLQNPVNQKGLAQCESYLDKVQFMLDLLDRRDQVYRFELAQPISGVEVSDTDVKTIKRTIQSIRKNQRLIGSGLDAFVVFDESELPGLPPEVCYKIAKEEETPRGRNTLKGEIKAQLDFYKLAQGAPNSLVGVPMPHYTIELPDTKIIAMEILQAVSVTQLLTGKGTLPDWLNIDRFAKEVEWFINMAHEAGLYHRDLHLGNIMVRQSNDVPEDGKWGYVIDFGLSLSGSKSLLADEDPYFAELATGGTFGYLHDDDIVSKLSNALHRYRSLKEEQDHD